MVSNADAQCIRLSLRLKESVSRAAELEELLEETGVEALQTSLRSLSLSLSLSRSLARSEYTRLLGTLICS
jgi:hypothetical protein